MTICGYLIDLDHKPPNKSKKKNLNQVLLRRFSFSKSKHAFSNGKKRTDTINRPGSKKLRSENSIS